MIAYTARAKLQNHTSTIFIKFLSLVKAVSVYLCFAYMFAFANSNYCQILKSSLMVKHYEFFFLKMQNQSMLSIALTFFRMPFFLTYNNEVFPMIWRQCSLSLYFPGVKIFQRHFFRGLELFGHLIHLACPLWAAFSVEPH